MPVRRTERTYRYDEMRERIIDKSAALFARNGYAATGVQELGEEVGLARGALYYYIKSKDGLLSDIHDRVLDPLLARASEVSGLPVSAPARLVLMSELLIGMIVERRDHVWVFLHEYHQLEGDNLTKFRRKRGRFEKHITDLITEGVKDGEFEVDDVRLATLSWLNLHNYTYQWASSERGVTVERLSSYYSRLFLKGVAATAFPFDELDEQAAKGRAELNARA